MSEIPPRSMEPQPGPPVITVATEHRGGNPGSKGGAGTDTPASPLPGKLTPVLVVLPRVAKGGGYGGILVMTLHLSDFVSDYVPWWEQVGRLTTVIPNGIWQVVWVRGRLGPQGLHRVAELFQRGGRGASG